MAGEHKIKTIHNDAKESYNCNHQQCGNSRNRPHNLKYTCEFRAERSSSFVHSATTLAHKLAILSSICKPCYNVTCYFFLLFYFWTVKPGRLLGMCFVIVWILTNLKFNDFAPPLRNQNHIFRCHKRYKSEEIFPCAEQLSQFLWCFASVRPTTCTGDKLAVLPVHIFPFLDSCSILFYVQLGKMPLKSYIWFYPTHIYLPKHISTGDLGSDDWQKCW